MAPRRHRRSPRAGARRDQPVVGDISSMFSGKVVAITGAARGIGRNVGMRFAAAGALVMVVDRDKDTGSATVRDLQALGHSAAFVEADLVHPHTPASIIEKIV